MSTPLLAPGTSADPIRPPLDFGWDNLEMWVVDRFGGRWDVSTWSTGVFFMPGVLGMAMPPLAHQTLEFANADGNSWNGLIVNAREVFWPTYLYHDSTSAEYLGLIDGWWKALSPFHTVRWFVRDASGSERYLDVRLTDDGGAGSEIDDVYYGWSKHGISLEASQPFWSSGAVTREFAQADPVPFFGPDGNNGPPFRPSRNSSTATATITNDGDVPAYLTWTLRGPIGPGATLGFGTNVIYVPFGLGSGEVLVIDTNPEVQTAFRNGAEVTELFVGRFDTGAIADGIETPLSIAFAGDGTASASLTPRHLRAYA